MYYGGTVQKTGKSPKLVCQLLQEASPGDKEQRKPSTQSLVSAIWSGVCDLLQESSQRGKERRNCTIR